MKLDFEGLNRHLLVRASTLLASWLPAGRLAGSEYVCGDVTGSPGDSLKINVKSGKWSDFATGEKGGDLISLYAAIKGLKPGDAYHQLAKDQGFVQTAAAPIALAHGPDLVVPPPGMPVPNMNHKKYGQPVVTYPYLGGNDELLHYVARYHEPSGDKQFVPWSYSKAGQWLPKAWPAPRPLLGLDKLARHPDRAVLIVEGEKCNLAARYIVGEIYVVISWSQGCKAWKQADWTPIYGRKVLLWPDADAPGVDAMAKIAAMLVTKCPEVKIIDVSGMPEKWDVADSDFSWQQFKEWAKPRAKLIERPLEPIQPEVLEPESGPLQIAASNGLVSAVYVRNNLPDKSDRGKVHGTLENFATMLNLLDVTIRYNVIAKREEIIIPGKSFSIDNRGNAAFAWLLSWCNATTFPVGQLKNFVTYVAEENQFNPVITWIESKPWDGRSRLQDLYNTVKAKRESGDPTIRKLKEAMLRRWMISAVAAAYLPAGVSAHGVLVFQGAQYIGKTKWFKNLVPTHLELVSDGRILRPDDKDSVKQIVSFWLVELGELDATFRKSDVAQLKSFLTKDRDVLRAAYAATESEFARRTVFFASVNSDVFLNDPTGNRRFWTISCESIDYDHTIDMQQLWAEVKTLFDAGDSWFLNSIEMDMLNAHNEYFTGGDPVQERVASDLDWQATRTLWSWKTVTQVLQSLGYDKATRSDLNVAGAEIRKLNGGEYRESNGRKLLFVPPKILNSGPNLPDGRYGH